ncbi:MAG: cupin domain-containing protein [Flavobacteriales bacterium]
MKHLIAVVISIAACLLSNAQFVQHISDMKPRGEWENVAIEKIADDSLCTTFLIWVKGGVKHHFHASHTESVYVISGSGTMDLGNEQKEINAGDYILIPKGTVHAVVAKEPLQILSTQTPQWLTDDRKFVEPLRRPAKD